MVCGLVVVWDGVWVDCGWVVWCHGVGCGMVVMWVCDGVSGVCWCGWCVMVWVVCAGVGGV